MRRGPVDPLFSWVPLLELRGSADPSVFSGAVFCLIASPRNLISLPLRNWSEGSLMISTLRVQTLETESLIEKIKAEIKKRAEAKAKRALLKRPKKLAKR
jgi:hypothetical protein